MRSERRVVVTGASSGIGLATAERFAREGARLALIARSEEGLAEAARRVREEGAPVAETIVADVSDRAAVEAAVDDAAARLGGIDIFVPAAAGLAYGAFDEMPPEVFERSFEVSFVGAMNSVRAALPHLERTGGILIAVVSMASRIPVPLHSPYVAAKHALRGCLATLRVELRSRGSGVRVCMVHPAFINTPFFEGSTSVPGTVPRPLRPVYRTEVVAEAILECARRPRPEVAVGGSAAAFTVLATVGRPLLDLILSTYGVRWQRTELPAPEPGMLWAPSGRARAHGRWGGRRSLWTALRLRSPRVLRLP
jgi:NAD(P)-dependent dehydrogenase (short-subunit alcohol dehydrogenase family)